MIPYVPTWEAHNTSAHKLVGKFTKPYKMIVDGMYPKMRVYPFFDKTSVIANCTPDSGSLSGTNTTNNIPTEVAGNWAVVSKIQLKYDNNGTEDITAKIEAADTPFGFASSGTHSDISTFTIAAGSNSTYNITLSRLLACVSSIPRGSASSNMSAISPPN